MISKKELYSGVWLPEDSSRKIMSVPSQSEGKGQSGPSGQWVPFRFRCAS